MSEGAHKNRERYKNLDSLTPVASPGSLPGASWELPGTSRELPGASRDLPGSVSRAPGSLPEASRTPVTHTKCYPRGPDELQTQKNTNATKKNIRGTLSGALPESSRPLSGGGGEPPPEPQWLQTGPRGSKKIINKSRFRNPRLLSRTDPYGSTMKRNHIKGLVGRILVIGPGKFLKHEIVESEQRLKQNTQKRQREQREITERSDRQKRQKTQKRQREQRDMTERSERQKRQNTQKRQR